MQEIKRERYQDRLLALRGNGRVKVITGIRRCGKSYLLSHLFKNRLLLEGVPADHIMEIAFDRKEHEALRDRIDSMPGCWIVSQIKSKLLICGGLRFSDGETDRKYDSLG